MTDLIMENPTPIEGCEPTPMMSFGGAIMNLTSRVEARSCGTRTGECGRDRDSKLD